VNVHVTSSAGTRLIRAERLITNVLQSLSNVVTALANGRLLGVAPGKVANGIMLMVGSYGGSYRSQARWLMELC
jgi:hypothetical protein